MFKRLIDSLRAAWKKHFPHHHNWKWVRTIWPYKNGWAWYCRGCRTTIDFITEAQYQAYTPEERRFIGLEK
jgi:hypothetical protein